MKIFATADNHLGKTLKMKKAMREMGIANFLDITNKVKAEEVPVDYVVFAGDVFDKDNTDVQSNYAYAKVLSDLSEIETIKKILVITGNHDQFNDYFNIAGIDIGNIIKSDKIVICNKDDMFYHDETDDVLFCLLPYNKKLFLTNEVGGKIIIDKINDFIINIMNKPEYRNSFKILVSHFAIEEWMPFGSETVSIKELRAGSHFDLVILGDLHNEDYQDSKETPVITYTGSTMHTNVSDLYNHRNCAKIIEVDQGVVSINKVEFYTPPVYLVNKENVETFDKKLINEKSVIITNDLEIHNNVKDRVLCSMYKPVVNTSGDIIETITEDQDLETLDVKQVAIQKIDSDLTINDETKKFLKFMVNLDVDSNSKKDIADMVYKEIMG